ncbi:outer membrane protein assembly factor BamA [Sphingomonas gilva]|uniref:Outer membrane protein assembly factor BamA n=2 Tax=Sphingomonas gilva TaxID=2305907 RepID=A0A396RK59_9SPHN|nr:outer membrane protein assembly factor BamA [Sphingomonas gilva]
MPAFAQDAPPPAATAPETPPEPAPAAQSAPATPQNAPATTPAQAAPVEQQRIIKSVTVSGSQRIEPDTVLQRTTLRPGQPYTQETLDQALRDLYASDLFADVQIDGVQTGELVIRIRENPVINRIVLEGNKSLKEDKIRPEIKLAPRQIFTRPAVRADVARIIELYRRQGRFAATVEPKSVALDQNRVDIVFEISEGPKSKVRQINIIGNEVFDDGKLRSQMLTKQARFFRIFSSGTSYDPDRLAYDQQKLRQFYLTEGYADFRVVSAVAELTPDRRDFVITYVVEEGERYKIENVEVDSEIRDFNNERLAASLPIKKGDWYNAQLVEDSVESISNTAGLVGYAFADVRPEFIRDKEARTMSLVFKIAESPRVYVERVDINGNTTTQDKVIRREMRLAEGDAFNSFQLKRSADRINSLGYFQENLEIEQKRVADDRVVLEANVQEKATGELQLSAGFSSLERFIINASIRQRNFRGKGQELRASVNYSTYSKSAEIGFTEPYLFDKNIAVGGDIFRRDYNAFNYSGDERQTTYSQVSTGFQLRTGVPITEYLSVAARYGLTFDDVSLDENQFFTGGRCDPLRAGRYLCDAIGERATSSVGYSIIYDSLNSRLRPSAGHRAVLSQDFAGLGGDVRYLRTRFDADKYWHVGGGFIFSVGLEGGYILPLEESRGPGIDKVRITDRFYLGEPQFRGFDIRGVGPRILRSPYTGTVAGGDQAVVTDRDRIVDDALGGRAYYLGRAELEIPLGAGARELGLRPSIFVDVGALWNVTRPLPTVVFPQATDEDGNLLFNEDGSPSLLPLVTDVNDSAGRPLYVVPSDATSNPGQVTTCQVGYSATAGGTCEGTSVNTRFTNTTNPFFEQFLGDTPKPRLSVGFGVNWNSPFGPLRIDVAKALITAEGDDPKLFTFNVGTQF